MFGLKKAVFVIHGFGGGVDDYQFFVDYLKANSRYELHPIVLPGHDQDVMYFVKYHEWINYAEDCLLQILDKYDQVYILGFSMGGVIAAHLAAKYPKIKKVVLVAAAFKYFTTDIIQNDLKELLYRESDDLKLEAKYKLVNDINRVIKRVKPRNVLEFVKLVDELVYSIRYVHQPVLILHGTNDELVPITSSEFAYNECPSKQRIFVKVDDGRHTLLAGKKQLDVTLLIIKFLKGGKIDNELI